MDVVKRSVSWRHEYWKSKIIAVVRVLLGAVLVYKGVYFVAHGPEIMSVLSRSNFGFGSMTIAHLIALCNLAGGVMIASGFLTRVAVLFQIPLLLSAVLFINAPHSVFHVYSEWVISVVVLVTLFFFLFFGPGYYSMDRFLRRKEFYQ